MVPGVPSWIPGRSLLVLTLLMGCGESTPPSDAPEKPTVAVQPEASKKKTAPALRSRGRDSGGRGGR